MKEELKINKPQQPKLEMLCSFSNYCGDCGNIIKDEEIFCIEIQSHVDSYDEA